MHPHLECGLRSGWLAQREANGRLVRKPEPISAQALSVALLRPIPALVHLVLEIV
jgi:hypothetical protein